MEQRGNGNHVLLLVYNLIAVARRAVWITAVKCHVFPQNVFPGKREVLQKLQHFDLQPRGFNGIVVVVDQDEIRLVVNPLQDRDERGDELDPVVGPEVLGIISSKLALGLCRAGLILLPLENSDEQAEGGKKNSYVTLAEDLISGCGYHSLMLLYIGVQL